MRMARTRRRFSSSLRVRDDRRRGEHGAEACRRAGSAGLRRARRTRSRPGRSGGPGRTTPPARSAWPIPNRRAARARRAGKGCGRSDGRSTRGPARRTVSPSLMVSACPAPSAVGVVIRAALRLLLSIRPACVIFDTLPRRLPGQQRASGPSSSRSRRSTPRSTASDCRQAPACRTRRQDDPSLAGARARRPRHRPPHDRRGARLDAVELRVLVARGWRRLRHHGGGADADRHLGPRRRAAAARAAAPGGSPLIAARVVFRHPCRIRRSMTSERFGDVSSPRATTSSPRSSCTVRRTTSSTSTSSARWRKRTRRSTAAPGCRAIVLCSEGKHFCAGVDFVRPSPQAAGTAALYGEAERLFRARDAGRRRDPGRRDRRRARTRVLGRLPRRDVPRRASRPTSPASASTTASRCRRPCPPSSASSTRSTCSTPDGASPGTRRRGSASATGWWTPARSAPRRTRFAAEIAASAPLAVRSIRATMRGDLADRARTAMTREAEEQDRLRTTGDWAEGIRAAAERRTPRFEGR